MSASTQNALGTIVQFSLQNGDANSLIDHLNELMDHYQSTGFAQLGFSSRSRIDGLM
jgi:hypothetical protein